MHIDSCTVGMSNLHGVRPLLNLEATGSPALLLEDPALRATHLELGAQSVVPESGRGQSLAQACGH